MKSKQDTTSIDNMLRNAGWTVNEDKKASHDVKQEFLVKHQPTNSGGLC